MTLTGRYIVKEASLKARGQDGEYVQVTLSWELPERLGGHYKTELTAQVPVTREDGEKLKIGDEFKIECYLKRDGGNHE